MKSQTFGVRLEPGASAANGQLRAIAAHFGTTARYIGHHLDDWRVPMPDGRHWTVERDGSVNDPCAEVVSPVCGWEDIGMVQEMVRALRKAGAKADASCGIHIHVGLGQHTPASLRRLVNLVNAKEDLLTQALGISPERRARWCKPVEPVFLAELNRRKPDTMEALAQLWYRTNNGGYTDWRRHAASHYDMSRYHLLNLHAAFSTERPAHTIEFRAFNGTLHAGEIKSYIQLCLAISPSGADPARPPARRGRRQTTPYTFRCWLRAGLPSGTNSDRACTDQRRRQRRLAAGLLAHPPDGGPAAPGQSRHSRSRETAQFSNREEVHTMNERSYWNSSGGTGALGEMQAATPIHKATEALFHSYYRFTPGDGNLPGWARSRWDMTPIHPQCKLRPPCLADCRGRANLGASADRSQIRHRRFQKASAPRQQAPVGNQPEPALSGCREAAQFSNRRSAPVRLANA